MIKQLALALALLILASLLGSRTWDKLMEKGAAADQGRMFHDLLPGATARFLIRGAREIHLASYFVVPKDHHSALQYSLDLIFLSASGAVREHRVVYLSIDTGGTRPVLGDGAMLARARMLRVQAPADTTVLQVGSPDGRILLQAGSLTTRHPSREALLRRSGAPLFWFKTDELQQVRAQRFMSLPRLGEMPGVKLPLAAEQEIDQTEDANANAAAPLRVGPHRALVFNVIGPGIMELTLLQEGTFSLNYVGVGGSGEAEFQGGHAALSIPDGASSIILRALSGSKSDVQMEAHNLRPIGGADGVLAPAERWTNAWRLDTVRTLRFPMYGQKAAPGPVRITARSLDGQTQKPLRWRFVDKRGHKLLDGLLSVEDQYDPFAAIRSTGATADIGAATQIFLVPPPGTAALETTAGGMLVEVDALLETGALPELLPPYDIALTAGLHWRDAATRAPRWLMLQPLASASDRRQLHVPLQRMPRIEERAGLAQNGPWVSLKPHGAVLHAQLAEPPRHPVSEEHTLTFLRTDQETPLIVAPKGKNANRVVVTCDLTDKLGGHLTLLVDGHKLASTPIATSTVRIEASAPAGEHRVRVHSARHGHCILEGHAPDEATFVRRQVHLLPARGSVSVNVMTRHRRAVPVHYAVYAESVEAPTDAVFVAKVDRGAPTRRVGSAITLTTGETKQQPTAAVAAGPMKLLHTHHVVWRVTESVVQLGDELPAGSHRITLRALSPGRYWTRFWIPGKPHQNEGAESWIITDALAPGEAGE